MKIGTRSVLFGAHQFIIHPIVLAIAWTKLYGFPRDLRLWVAFFVHDLGYWGKPNMDGPEGEEHVWFGARLMHFLFDRTEIVDRALVPYGNEANRMLANGWQIDSDREDYNEVFAHVHLCRFERSHTWHDFCLFHSRFFAMRYESQPSKLCIADKLAIAIEPWWLYLPRVWITGEAREYMDHRYNEGGKYNEGRDRNRPTLREWHQEIRIDCLKWVDANRGAI